LTDAISKPRILIVEDDLENQKFLRVFLRKTFEIQICDSSESFYAKLNQFDFDVILMDISLRGSKDGFELTKELRVNPKYKDIAVVGLSAHAFQKDIENAYASGIDIFVTKPVHGNLLMDSLKSALEKRAGIKLS